MKIACGAGAFTNVQALPNSYDMNIAERSPSGCNGQWVMGETGRKERRILFSASFRYVLL